MGILRGLQDSKHYGVGNHNCEPSRNTITRSLTIVGTVTDRMKLNFRPLLNEPRYVRLELFISEVAMPLRNQPQVYTVRQI